MSSAVRNRIASYEERASQNNGSAPNSPALSQATNRSSRRSNSVAAGSVASSSSKRRSTSTSSSSRQQQQSSQQQASLYNREPPGVSPLWNNSKTKTKAATADASTTAASSNNHRHSSSLMLPSTTVAASENRKSRLRQQLHQNSSGGGSSGGVNVNGVHQQGTNLMEKRKLIKERRLMQKQKQRRAGFNDEEQDGPGASTTANNDSQSAAAAAATTSSRSVTPTAGSSGTTNNNNTTTTSSSNSDSPGRFAKMSRMTRRSKLRNNNTNTSSSNSQPHQQPSSSTASATATNVTTGSSTATSLIRNTTTMATTSAPVGTQQQYHSPVHATSSHSSSLMRYGSRADPEGQLSMDNPTDDDATLTSVRQIMDPQHHHYDHDKNHHHHHHHNNNNGQMGSRSNNIKHGSYDSVNSSQLGGISSSSWRPISSRKGGGGYQSLNNSSGQPASKSGLYNNNNNNQHHHTNSTNALRTGGVWMEEEKSDKTMANNALSAGPRVLRTASSSDYDTDGDMSKRSQRSAQRLLHGPGHSQTTDVNDFFENSKYATQQQRHYHGSSTNPSNNNTTNSNSNIHNLHQSSTYHNASSSINSGAGPRRIDDDERTFDYGDRDDDSNGSTSYAMRRRKEAERKARLGADSRKSSDTPSSQNPDHSQQQQQQNKHETEVGEGLPQLLSKEDMEKYTKTMENPAMKLGAGVVGVATVGCIAFGPVGLLVGVAAVGLGFGVMQIPEEERNKIQAKAEKAMHNLQEKAGEASEKVSSSCLTTYKDSGVADHLPHCLSGADGEEKDMDSARSETVGKADGNVEAASTTKRSHGNNHHPNQASKANAGGGPQVEQPPTAQVKQHHNDRLRNKKVACLRNVRIMPVAHIHGLEPSAQPRAWLDIVASANTSNSQKNEAMEEILLLAKDKRRAKIFLDEGILDSIIWTLSRYFEKLDVVGKQTNWSFPDISRDERLAANLSAQCCVTLGKAHCAAIHTEGDLQLMSMYERGTVPEERQVAQMLHEVPHHTRITKTDDPTIVEPNKEVFALRQLTLPQAEELARSIKAVADGQL